MPIPALIWLGGAALGAWAWNRHEKNKLTLPGNDRPNAGYGNSTDGFIARDCTPTAVPQVSMGKQPMDTDPNTDLPFLLAGPPVEGVPMAAASIADANPYVGTVSRDDNVLSYFGVTAADAKAAETARVREEKQREREKGAWEPGGPA